jgi:hypothetical protein
MRYAAREGWDMIRNGGEAVRSLSAFREWKLSMLGKQVQQEPYRDRQAISANTAVQRSTLGKTDMQLFVGINVTVDWSKAHGER